MYFLHAINSDRQTRLLNVLEQIAMILGDKKNYYGHRCVSTSHVAVFRVISLRRRIPEYNYFYNHPYFIFSSTVNFNLKSCGFYCCGGIRHILIRSIWSYWPTHVGDHNK